MKARDYRKKSDKELKDLIKQLELRKVQSYGVKQKEKIENVVRLRKEIARINTILTQRKNEI